MPNCYVLDVGHGNCAVVEGRDGCVIVDAGRGDGLILFLEELNIASVRALLLSHADADHIQGALALLSKVSTDPNFTLTEVWVPSDPRDTDTWDDLITHAGELNRAGRVSLHVGLHSNQPAPFDLGDSRVSVVAPPPEAVAKGIGGRVRGAGRGKQNANRLSAVVKVELHGNPAVLLPGDMDGSGLRAAVTSNFDLSASVLVFPHHGGNPGATANVGGFAKNVLDRSRPESVLFSSRSADPKFPNVEIVEGVCGHDSKPRVISIGTSPNMAVIATDAKHINGSGTVRVSWDSGRFVLSCKRDGSYIVL